MLNSSRVPWRALLEGCLIAIALFYGIRWYLNPQGPFEPIVSLCTTLLAGLTFLSGRKWPDTHEAPASAPVNSIRKEPEIPALSVDAFNAKLPPFRFNSSAAFFEDRFSSAFPGLRTIEWFQGAEAVERLSILLAAPLGFTTAKESVLHPIWWLRAGNSHIESFSVIDRQMVLLDEKELQVGKIAAVYSSNYKRLFVYVECMPMQPTGVYQWTSENIQNLVKDFGYAWEEYGLFKGTHRISRAEYDDRATSILGKVVQMDSELVLRIRYITTYSFVLVPHDSPINVGRFDAELDEFLKQIPVDPSKLDELVKWTEALPSRGV